MSTMKAEPIAGPEAWLGADMARSVDWIRTVSATAVAELDAARRAAASPSPCPPDRRGTHGDSVDRGGDLAIIDPP